VGVVSVQVAMYVADGELTKADGIPQSSKRGIHCTVVLS
jgi:hypothetical protein